jgi:hypothetical protein
MPHCYFWPLELCEPYAAPQPREFSYHVTIVKAARSAFGRDVTNRLAREGPHVVLSSGNANTLNQIAMSLPVGTARPGRRSWDSLVWTFLVADPVTRRSSCRILRLEFGSW